MLHVYLTLEAKEEFPGNKLLLELLLTLPGLEYLSLETNNICRLNVYTKVDASRSSVHVYSGQRHVRLHVSVRFT